MAHWATSEKKLQDSLTDYLCERRIRLLSDRSLKNYEGRGKQLNVVPNIGSEPHTGAKFAQLLCH